MENKVLGIETVKYLNICYMLVLIASGFGLFSNLLGLVGMSLFGGFITGILGLVGIGLVATALIGFKEKFSALDVSHFIFLLALFVVFFILAWILQSILYGMGIFGAILLFVLSAFQFALLFSGLQIWKQRQEATKDNIINGLKNLTSKFKK